MDVVACAWLQFVALGGSILATILVFGFICFVLAENTNFFAWINPVERVRRRFVRRAWQRKELQRAASSKSRHK